MKAFIVTVDKKMVDGKVYCTHHFKIYAHTEEEAREFAAEVLK